MRVWTPGLRCLRCLRPLRSGELRGALRSGRVSAVEAGARNSVQTAQFRTLTWPSVPAAHLMGCIFSWHAGADRLREGSTSGTAGRDVACCAAGVSQGERLLGIPGHPRCAGGIVVLALRLFPCKARRGGTQSANMSIVVGTDSQARPMSFLASSPSCHSSSFRRSHSSPSRTRRPSSLLQATWCCTRSAT